MNKLKAKIKSLRDASLKDYKENRLLTNEVIGQIEEQHSLDCKDVNKNVYLEFNKRIIEFDVLIAAYTPSGQLRWINIELKEGDTSKAINQSINRRDFVHYSYVILNNSVKWIVEYLIYVYNREIKINRIGFFSNNTFVLSGKYKNPIIEIEKNTEVRK